MANEIFKKGKNFSNCTKFSHNTKDDGKRKRNVWYNKQKNTKTEDETEFFKKSKIFHKFCFFIYCITAVVIVGNIDVHIANIQKEK